MNWRADLSRYSDDQLRDTLYVLARGLRIPRLWRVIVPSVIKITFELVRRPA